MQTSPLRQSLFLAMSPLHSTSQPVPLSGHRAPSAAVDTPGKKARTPVPKIVVLISFSALRRERVPLSSPLANSPKEYSSVVSSRIASPLSSFFCAATEHPPLRLTH